MIARTCSTTHNRRGGMPRKTRSRRALDDVAHLRLAIPGFEAHGEAPQSPQMRNDLRRGVGQRAPAAPVMAKRERAVAIALVADDLDVGPADVLRVLLREKLAHALVAALVVHAVDDELALVLVIGDREQVEIADQPRRHVL